MKHALRHRVADWLGIIIEPWVLWRLSSEPISAHHSILNLLRFVKIDVRVGALRILEGATSLREHILLVKDVLRCQISLLAILPHVIRVDCSLLLSVTRLRVFDRFAPRHICIVINAVR